MISGTLLLRKQENFYNVFRKRIFRVIVVMICFEAMLYLLRGILHFKNVGEFDISLGNFINSAISGNIEGSYWYLYAYLGFLVLLPFLQSICKDIDISGIFMLLVLHFIFSSLIPVLNIILSSNWGLSIKVSSDFSVPLATTKVFFYSILGYYLDNKIKISNLKSKHILLLIIASIVGIFISNVCTLHEGIVTEKFTQNYVQLFDYITTISAFIIIKYLLNNKFLFLNKEKYAKVIIFAGSLTFGIYLLDPFLKTIFYSNYSINIEPYLPTLIVSVLWVVISMTAGGIITFVLKQIPGFRKIL